MAEAVARILPTRAWIGKSEGGMATPERSEDGREEGRDVHEEEVVKSRSSRRSCWPPQRRCSCWAA